MYLFFQSAAHFVGEGLLRERHAEGPEGDSSQQTFLHFLLKERPPQLTPASPPATEQPYSFSSFPILPLFQSKIIAMAGRKAPLEPPFPWRSDMLKGQKAIVTGGSAGIGAAITESLVRERCAADC